MPSVKCQHNTNQTQHTKLNIANSTHAKLNITNIMIIMFVSFYGEIVNVSISLC